MSGIIACITFKLNDMKIYTIKFYFYGSNQVVPFDYWDNVLSFLHNEILGQNNSYHNSTSLYSISPLFNSKTVKGGLLFNKGAIWLIRTPSKEVLKDFYLKSKNAINKELGWGLTLKEIHYPIVTEFEKKSEIVIGTSPVFLGQNKNSKERDHITYLHGNEITSACMRRTFLTKTNEFGYSFDENKFNIEFDLSHPITTKRVLIGGASNIATQGKVKITGGSDVIALCYGLGIGRSTGCGFGFIYNYSKYHG